MKAPMDRNVARSMLCGRITDAVTQPKDAAMRKPCGASRVTRSSFAIISLVSAHSPSVLIVRLDAIGDALTLVPAIAQLRSHGLRVSAVLSRANAAVFSARALDRRHVAAPNLHTMASEIQARRYGHALVATEKIAGYRIAALAHIPDRIGFENGWGKPLKTLWVRRLCTKTIFRTAGLDPQAPHECEVLYKLARALLPNTEPPRDPALLRPFVLDEEPAADSRIVFQVTDKWVRLGAPMEEVVHYARLIARLEELRFVSARREEAFASAFADRTGCTIEFFSETAPWKTALASARAVAAPDSGATHIAGMTGTPVVACFAAPRFELQTARWRPWAAPHEIVRIVRGWPEVAADAMAQLLSGTPSSTTYTG